MSYFRGPPTKKRKFNMVFGNNPKDEENSNDDEEIVETIDNNIYFYSEVTTKSCFNLIKQLKMLDMKLQTQKLRNNLDNVHIDLHIHTYGGDLYGAFAVIDVIRTLKTPVHSYIEGIAASAGTIISVVCDRRYMYKHSYMLIHQLSSFMGGKFQEIEDEFNNCQEFMTVIKNLYKEHTNVNKRKLDEILKHDLWWDAKTCLENKLVDEIL